MKGKIFIILFLTLFISSCSIDWNNEKDAKITELENQITKVQEQQEKERIEKEQKEQREIEEQKKQEEIARIQKEAKIEAEEKARIELELALKKQQEDKIYNRTQDCLSHRQELEEIYKNQFNSSSQVQELFYSDKTEKCYYVVWWYWSEFWNRILYEYYNVFIENCNLKNTNDGIPVWIACDLPKIKELKWE